VGKAAATATSAQQPLSDALVADTFPTVLGPIGFGAEHELRDNPYRLMEWKQDRFTPIEIPLEGD
ncbi:MAG TPA: ABC transporter substrate-binding protein, partial [Mycoplana sp.]|nr:ABC transporter substrate-binding protein [Mycoplana sp.]